MDYKKLKIVKKRELSSVKKLCDLTVEDTQSYITENGVINHNSGIAYNSSVTLELFKAKLVDKENDEASAKRTGNEAVKNGVMVTAKPQKSRFCIPQKVKFQIPFFKKPNPFVGLESYLTWENSGVERGTVLEEKAFLKLSPADQLKCHKFEYEGNILYSQPKDTARGIVVKHLGRQVNFIEFFSETVFTDDFLKMLDEKVIKPLFQLPDQSSYDDVKELEESLGIEDED